MTNKKLLITFFNSRLPEDHFENTFEVALPFQQQRSEVDSGAEQSVIDWSTDKIIGFAIRLKITEHLSSGFSMEFKINDQVFYLSISPLDLDEHGLAGTIMITKELGFHYGLFE